MQRITVIVKPGSKIEKIVTGEENSDEQVSLTLYTKAPAKEGKANHAVIKALAAYFKVPQSNIHIKFGLTAKEKIIEIN